MAGKPSFSMAWAMNSPSADSEISARIGCFFEPVCGQAFGESGMRACHRQRMAPPSVAQTSSAFSSPSRVQRRVENTSRT